jgi:6-methylsalicylate decarboxylase
MIVDVHAHYWTPEYLDLLVALGKTDTGAQRGLGAGPGEELEARLALMDRAGVDLQVLSAAPQLPYATDEAKAVEAARFVNDQYARLVREHPQRFLAFAATPMPHIAACLAETKRALEDLSMAGVTMTTTVLGRALVEPEFEPVFADLDRRGAVLFLHPAGNSACSPLIRDYQMTWMVGAPVEDTIAVMQLITRGFPSRYPNIKFINSHLGGALPMLLGRADDQYRWEAPQTPEAPSLAARRMWYDSVGHGYAPALQAGIAAVGADRLVLGTDFPYETGDTYVRAVDYIRDAASAEEAAAVLEKSAATLFGALLPRDGTHAG